MTMKLCLWKKCTRHIILLVMLGKVKVHIETFTSPPEIFTLKWKRLWNRIFSMSNFHNRCLFFGATEIRILIHSIVQYGHNRNGLMYIKCIGAGIYASEYSLVWQEGHSRPPSISWPRALCEDQKQNSRTSQNFDNLGLAQNTRLIFNLTEIVASDFVQRFTQLVVVLSWSCERHLLMLWLSKCCRSCLGNKKNGNGSSGIICTSIVSLSLSPLSQKTVSFWNFKPWGGKGHFRWNS